MVDAKLVVGIAIAALIVLIILAVAPMIGSTIDDVDTTQDDTTAAVVVTVGVGIVGETLNMSTETYTISDLAVGAFNVGNGSAIDIGANLTAEITANSTLFTAVDGADGTVTVTTILKGTEMNDYACTTNITDSSCAAATFLGAVDGGDWSPDSDTGLNTPATTWITFVGLIILAFLAIIIGIVIKGFKDMSGKE